MKEAFIEKERRYLLGMGEGNGQKYYIVGGFFTKYGMYLFSLHLEHHNQTSPRGYSELCIIFLQA
jgi:hypothetical protein